MNDYTHALAKEIAAQQLGYLPSHVWGKIGKKEKHRHDKASYRHVMRSNHPEEVANLKVMEHIKEIGERFKKGVPDKSHIQKKNIHF